MRTFFKIAGGLLAALLLLLALAALLLTRAVDPNEYRDQVAAWVKKSTGRDLTIGGDIELSFFPWLGLKVGDVTLSNAPGFGDEPFLKLANANLRVKVLPLLRRELQIDTLAIEGLRAALAVNAEGVGNWADLTGAPPPTELPAPPPQAQATAKKDQTPGAGLAGIALGGVRIGDAQVVWQDAKTKSRIELTDLNIEMGAISADKPAPIDVHTRFANADPAVTGTLSAAASMRLAPATQQATLTDLNITLDAQGDSLPGGKLTAVLNGGLALDLIRDSARLTDLVLKLDDAEVKGNLEISHFDDPAVRFELSVEDIDLDRYLAPPDAHPTADAKPDEAPVNPLAGVLGVAALDSAGTLKIGKLKVANLRGSDILITLKAKDRLVDLIPLQAKLYGGSYLGEIHLDGRHKQIAATTKASLDAVQLGDLLHDAAEIDVASGVAELKSELRTAGTEARELTAGLNGTLDFQVRDGIVKGINVDKAICQARGAVKGLQGKETEACDPSSDTKFNTIRGTSRITNGILVNDDLLIEQQRYQPDKLLHITGKGSVDLPKETIDYRATAARMERRQDGSLQPKGVAIPVAISGTFDKITVRPDLSGLAREEAKGKLREQLDEKLQDDASDSPTDKLKKDLLRGLFGR